MMPDHDSPKPEVILNGTSAHSQKDPHRKWATCYQGLAAGAVTVLAIACGMPIGYSAILIPQLQATNSTLAASDEESSWIASVHSISSPIGALLSGLLMDYFGRIKTLRLLTIPFFVGWLLTAGSQSFLMLIFGRLLTGLAVGLSAPPAQVYLGEVCEPRLRGALSASPYFSYSLGILIVYTLGSLLDWRIVAGVGSVLPVLSFMCFLFLPESPSWLAARGRAADAQKAMAWFRGGDELKAKEELSHAARIEASNVQTSDKGVWATRFHRLREPSVLRPLVLVTIYIFLQQMSGVFLIVFYAVNMFQTMGGELDSYLATVITGALRTIITFAACFLFLSSGRRILSLISAVGMTISITALAVYITIVKTDESLTQSTTYTALTLSLLLMYIASNTIGVFIVPGILIGETFPRKERGILSAITTFLLNTTTFGIVKSYPNIVSAFGIEGVFYMFSVFSIILVVFIFLFLPETHGRTLQQVENHFATQSILWCKRNRVQDETKP